MPGEAPEAAAGTGLRERLERDGFLHIKGFASLAECEGMKHRMQELIAAWDPLETKVPVFVTDAKQQMKAQGSSDYFLDSASRIHFFLEKDAADGEGVLKKDIAKAKGLNKVGHGLHLEDPVFREYSNSQKVADLAKELGWEAPVLPQSMYIFKQPRVGGEVTSHQDSTFLHTTPRETCLGLWLALDPAGLENGCIWARPGSHKEAVRSLFVRNPAYFEAGDRSAAQMIFEDCKAAPCPADVWHCKMPEGSAPPSQGLKDKGFVPVICAVGDLVVIHGSVDHLSLANTSDLPRETFQLHLVEGPDAGVAWGASNWLQYPEGLEFPRLGFAKAPERKRKAVELEKA